MIASETLAKGVARGIITADQAERLRALEHAGVPPELPATPDDEQLRFIGGFSDIFVTIGLAMFLGAIGFFGAQSGGPWGMGAAIAITAWLLAEFFTRVRRMALPSIVLLIVFAIAVFSVAALLNGPGADATADVHLRTAGGWFGLGGFEPTTVAVAGFVTVLATALHYWRFRVPITVAAGCCALTGMVVGLVSGLTPSLPPVAYNVVTFACGLAVFALAMRFDIADPARLTRRTDIAFWLHLLASPLIVHSLIKGMVTDAAKLSPATAVAIMALFLALSFVAVLIDRRALLVSGLAYAGIAFWTLASQVGLSGMTTPLTLLVLGAFVLLLSAGWRPLRAGILGITPAALTRRLPQPTLSV
jgi:hypothetical protein